MPGLFTRMPSGKTHLLLNTLLLPLAGGAVAFALGPEAALRFALGYAVTTVFLSPDLDLNEPNYNQYLVRRHVDWLTPYFWYWKPYGRLFTHRGISHGYVLGTVTRWVYLFPLLYAARILWAWQAWPWPSFPEGDVAVVLLGGLVADAIHITADRWTSRFKRWRRRRAALKEAN